MRLATARVFSFLEASGVRLDRVTPHEYSGMGLGLAAAVPLRLGEVALQVPRACWLPFSAVAARERMVKRSSAAVARVDSLARGGSLGDAALLAAHLELSPHGSQAATWLGDIGPPDVPLLWPPALRRALLHGTSAAPATESQAQLAALICEALTELRTGDSSSALGGGDFDRGFRVAQAALLSRAHAGKGKPLALVPGLDLLNHAGGEANAAVELDAVSGAFQLVVSRDLQSGEQLTIDYGALPPHKFLRLYGFVPPAAGPGSSDEEVLLQLLPTGAEGAAEAEAALRASGLPTRIALRWADASAPNLPDYGGSSVLLPLDGLRADARVAAVHVLARAVLAQLDRLAQGSAACEAVRSAGVSVGVEVVRRAELCAALNRREAVMLERTRVQLARVGVEQ